jgi:hypothetical protein
MLCRSNGISMNQGNQNNNSNFYILITKNENIRLGLTIK